MFNNLLIISPFIYGISIIFSVFLLRIKQYKALAFPLYLSIVYFLIERLYVGEIDYSLFCDAVFFVSLTYLALMHFFVCGFNVKIVSASMPAIFMSFASVLLNGYALLFGFYAISAISIVVFIVVFIRERRKKYEQI